MSEREPAANSYEDENQAMLEAYGAEEISVLRNAENGKILNAVATYSDGMTEVLYHASLRSNRPKRVHFSTSTRSGAIPAAGAATSRRTSELLYPVSPNSLRPGTTRASFPTRVEDDG